MATEFIMNTDKEKKDKTDQTNILMSKVSRVMTVTYRRSVSQGLRLRIKTGQATHKIG